MKAPIILSINGEVLSRLKIMSFILPEPQKALARAFKLFTASKQLGTG